MLYANKYIVFNFECNICGAGTTLKLVCYTDIISTSWNITFYDVVEFAN